MPDQNNSEVLPSAPPPPQEVKVRTLKSDLASVAASGGGLPKYQNVKISPSDEQKNSAGLFTVLSIVVLVVVILAIAAYFIYQLVLKK